MNGATAGRKSEMDLGERPTARQTAESTGAVTAELRTADGWPVSAAVLTVIDGTGTQVARVQGDAQGSAAAAGLSRGSYTAIITAAGYQPVARTAFVPDAQTAALGIVELQRVGGQELPSAGTWQIDPAHSSILVTAQHLGITGIHGRFTEFSGSIRVANPIESSAIGVRIEASSIDTANAMRDDHLRSADFLHVERFPAITFASTAVGSKGSDRWDIDGDLTLCGVTRPVRLDTRFAGVGPDPWGGTRASASATTQLHREDFAMTFNQSLANGIAAIGTTLRVDIDIQAVRED
jgi:polyisoprenoid-binding protein YceI